MRRSCSRPGCAAAAAATFAYEYASSTVWLDDLATEPHPATYDLCAAHADRLAPPRGWQLADRRMPQRTEVPGSRWAGMSPTQSASQSVGALAS